MAVLALHRSVGSEKREAILVIPYLLNCNIPSLDGMAFGAVRAHLPLVNVGVAILAILTGVGEDRLRVALGALHFFVHPAERITGFIMVELGDSADGTPACGGMAVLARNSQEAVRTAGVTPLPRR